MISQVAAITRLLGALGLCAVLAIACSSDERAPLAAGCHLNTDCVSPLVCAFQRCHNACASSRDCKVGQRCVEGDRPFHVCQLDQERTCSFNSDCPGGQSCGADHQCRDQCRTDRDCLVEQLCLEGTCADRGETVDGGVLFDVPRDASVDASGAKPCVYTSDCDPPLVCRQKTCSAACRTSLDCRQGADCVGGQCVSTSSSLIGDQGGVAVSASGRVKLTVPPHALDAPTAIAIQALETWPAGAVGQAFEIVPLGVALAVPATVEMSYATDDLGAVDPGDLSVGVAAASTWTRLTSQIDTEKKVLTAAITRLSVCGLVGPLPVGAGTGMDASVNANDAGDTGVGVGDASLRDASGSPEGGSSVDAPTADHGAPVVCTWTPFSRPPQPTSGPMAFDVAHRQIVLVVDNPVNESTSDTWLWDGALWSKPILAYPLPSRGGHALAYDSARAKTVLFGGSDDSHVFAETWEWDGSAWKERTPEVSPPARDKHSMAYDSARGKTVLFGGSSHRAQLADTWEWDGDNWTEVMPSTKPTARDGASMAYDARRGKTVLFGGNARETWEWDGNNWTLRTPSSSPSGQYNTTMAYDSARSRIVLTGGETASNTFSAETWEWDGTDWTRSSAMAPTATWSTGMAFDSVRTQIVLFADDAVWERSATDWVRKTPWPHSRARTSVVYDAARGQTLLFGGGDASPQFLSDTWTWDGVGWSQRFPAANPPARRNHALSYDTIRSQVVLFGGDLNGSAAGDTWEWDGSNWLQQAPVSSPSARSGHAMAFDAARGVTLLFGGTGLADTWQWDGTNWTQRSSAAHPPAGSGYAMAYDKGRNKVVLFDGKATWEWDGANWTQLSPLTSPSTRQNPAMTYDTVHHQVVLFGGYAPATGVLADSWAWDGMNWAPLSKASLDGAYSFPALTYDSARGRVVLWQLLGTWESSATACPGDGGQP